MGKDVVAAEPIGPLRLRLTFEGGERREIAVDSLVPLEGVFERLRDSDFFRQVQVNPEIGTVVWPNGADFCPDVLYEKSKPVPEDRTSASLR